MEISHKSSVVFKCRGRVSKAQKCVWCSSCSSSRLYSQAALPIPFTMSVKMYGTLAPFTHHLRQMGSSRGKTTFPSLLFLSLDNEETNPHLVTDGLKTSFVRTTFRSPAHISLPWRMFLRGALRGAEGALPPAHRH